MVINDYVVKPENGLIKTLIEMNKLERAALNNVDFVRFVYSTFYTTCSPCIPGKIYNYMKDNFIYEKDVPDEKITAPYLLIKTKTGDCDDFSLFAKTCIDILPGWQSNYLLLGVNKNEFTHVVTFAYRGRHGLQYIDPVIIDGANEIFNTINNKYKYKRLVV